MLNPATGFGAACGGLAVATITDPADSVVGYPHRGPAGLQVGEAILYGSQTLAYLLVHAVEVVDPLPLGLNPFVFPLAFTFQVVDSLGFLCEFLDPFVQSLGQLLDGGERHTGGVDGGDFSSLSPPSTASWKFLAIGPM